MRAIKIVLTICMTVLWTLPQSVSAVETLQIGDYIQIGIYNNQPMKWRYVGEDESGKLVFSDSVICYKAFDASGIHSNDYNQDRETRGSNQWNESNIRSWLNSDSETVDFICGNIPTAEKIRLSFYAFDPDYSKEKGFLTNFSVDEKNMLKTVTLKTPLNVVDLQLSEGKYQGLNIASMFDSVTEAEKDYITSVDTMFLIDEIQVNMVKENLDDNFYANNKRSCGRYSLYSRDEDISADDGYMLRSPNPRIDCSSLVCTVSVSDGTGEIHLNQFNSAYAPRGVRPAFYLADDAEFVYGTGTEADPYRLAEDMGSQTPEPAKEYITVINKVSGLEVTVMSKAIEFTDARPYIDEHDRTQIPVRAVAESLNYDVDYDETKKIVTVKKEDKLITLEIGSNKLNCNGEVIEMDTCSLIKDDRVYIPIRFVGEALGYNVEYREQVVGYRQDENGNWVEYTASEMLNSYE